MSNVQPPYPGQPGQPTPSQFGQGAAQPIPPQQPVPPPASPVAPTPAGAAGIVADPSTLAATGLLAAVLFAIVAGLFRFIARPISGGIRERLLQLTDTVDVGDVALLGIAVALLLLTPDPPGGLNRPLLLKIDAALAGIIAVYSVIRALVIMSQSSISVLYRFGGFVATVGLGIAAATIAFYAAKESFLKQQGRI